MAKFDHLHITQKSILLKKVLRFMHKMDRPVLIGEVALETKEHLDLVEDALEWFSDPHLPDRQIEKVDPGDPAHTRYDGWVRLYRLTVTSSLHIAHGEDELKEYRRPDKAPFFCGHAIRELTEPCPCPEDCYCRGKRCAS